MLELFFAVVRNFRSDKKGVTALEYGLLAALIGLVIITAVTLLGTNLSGLFNKIANSV